MATSVHLQWWRSSTVGSSKMTFRPLAFCAMLERHSVILLAQNHSPCSLQSGFELRIPTLIFSTDVHQGESTKAHFDFPTRTPRQLVPRKFLIVLKIHGVVSSVFLPSWHNSLAYALNAKLNSAGKPGISIGNCPPMHFYSKSQHTTLFKT